MNGEEVEGRPRYTAPTPSSMLGIRVVAELTQGEKTDLLMFAQTEVAKTVFKVMEMEIIDARDEAMACDPSEVVKQKALMDTAHAMAKFYTRIRNKMSGVVDEFKQLAAEAEVEEAMDDQEFIQNAILASVLNQPTPVRKPQ